MSSIRYDVAAVRAHFPSLQEGAAHFDGPGGTQTPDVVAQAMYDTLAGPLSNDGAMTLAERNASDVVLDVRVALGDLLGADPGGIVFGRSMTQLTFDLSRTMAKDWGPGDEIVVTRLDHDGNVRPWVLAAEARGATVRWADFDTETGELDPSAIGRLLTERTKVVAVTAASNLIGTMPDIPAIADRVHQSNAWLYVDGVHFTAHAPVDFAALGADFYACSPYKFLGPHCGVVAGRVELLEQLRPDKLKPATDQVPMRFEYGTPSYELMAGTTAAINFLADLAPGAVPADASRRERILASMAALEDYENVLRDRIEREIAEFPGVTSYSRAARRAPTLLCTFDGHRGSDIYAYLGSRGVSAPAGSFYAYEASRSLGLGEAGGVRIGVAPYNDDSDVDRLLAGLTAYFSR
jgi:cysteine desulfurase family protein (TIGR01976 family)